MNLLNKCCNRFSSLIKFWSSEKILKIRSQIYILTKKVIILREIHVTMNSFVKFFSFLQPFQFEPDQKKAYGNDSHEKEAKHIDASAADLLHIRIENLYWCKCRHCKNEAREIDFL